MAGCAILSGAERKIEGLDHVDIPFSIKPKAVPRDEIRTSSEIVFSFDHEMKALRSGGAGLQMRLILRIFHEVHSSLFRWPFENYAERRSLFSSLHLFMGCRTCLLFAAMLVNNLIVGWQIVGDPVVAGG